MLVVGKDSSPGADMEAPGTRAAVGEDRKVEGCLAVPGEASKLLLSQLLVLEMSEQSEEGGWRWLYQAQQGWTRDF